MKKRGNIKKFIHSTWFFPAVLTVILLCLTVLKINGSSIGVYHDYFYGSQTKDKSLLANKPRAIRSDEWLVATEMTIAQSNDGYKHINQNIGHGQDMSVIIDVPYKEWSELFKPQNWSFFVMPFDFAFAMKWWIMGYILVLSCYFFILALLPGKKLLAVLLSLSLLFSAFIQWWYQYITLAPVYYSFLIATGFIYFTRAKQFRTKLIISGLLAYLFISFALVLYPPFQIACALALGAFVTGYGLEHYIGKSRRMILKDLLALLAAVFISLGIVGLFLVTRSDVVHAAQNTVYPGKRVVASGNYDLPHFLSGHLGFEFQFGSKASHYSLPQYGLTNQSENSGFILLLPFLFVPSMYLLTRNYLKRREVDWPLLLVNCLFVLLFVRLFVPHFSAFFKLLLLDKVPQKRLILGIGVLSFMQLVLFIRNLNQKKSRLPNLPLVLVYCISVLAVELLLSMHAVHAFPGFISKPLAILFSLPVPVIIYLLLSKRHSFAALLLFILSLSMTIGVHPMYRGTSVVRSNPLSLEVKQLANTNSGYWATDDPYLENFALLNGAPSLSGVYTYPQFDTWSSIDRDASQSVYNRYAHVTFTFDQDKSTDIGTTLTLVGADHFSVKTEACGAKLHNAGLRFIITEKKLAEACIYKTQTVNLPTRTFYIYQLN